MKRIILLIIFNQLIIVLLLGNKVNSEAVSDMTAFMQYSSPYRFSSNLIKGDSLEYVNKIDSTLVKIFVISETDSTLLIIEQFDQIEIHQEIDKKTHNLLKMTGYDEEKNIINYSLLSKEILASRIEHLKNHFPEYKNKASTDTVLVVKSKRCNVTKYDFSKEKVNTNEVELKISVTILSSDIKKMLPCKSGFLDFFRSDMNLLCDDLGLIENDFLQVN